MQQFTKSDFKIIEHTTAFKGYFSIEKYKLCFKLFAGGWSDEVTREVFERGSAVAVIPFDPITKQLVLVEQFRIGALTDKKSPWLLEPVAGIIGPNETLEEVARREMQEEAGIFRVKKLTPLYDYWVSPGGCTEHLILFYAEIDIKNIGTLCGLVNEHEDIKVHVFTLAEAKKMLQDGTINTAIGIVALQWLLLNNLS